MSMTFRVEAFIVPSSNRERKSENIIDDVKFAYKLREIDHPNKLECINEDSEFSDNSILDKSVENCENLEENEFNIAEKSELIPEILHNSPIKIDDFSLKKPEEPIYEVPIEQSPPEIPKIIKNQRIPLPSLPISSSSPKSPKSPKKSNKSLKSREEDAEDEKNVRELISRNIPIKIDPEDNSSEDDDITDPIYDIPYAPASKKPAKPEFESKIERFRSKTYHPKPPIRSTSLMSIDERGETPDDFEQLCCNGLKHACKTQKPQEVTDEIFEVNLMKRLENLRAREAVIREKEAALFERERLLFKKEKELRILERLIKDKLKHAELCSKRVKNWDSAGSEGSKDRQLASLESLESIKSDPAAPAKSLGGRGPPTKINQVNQINQLIGNPDERIEEAKSMRNPPNSRSSLVSSAIFVEPHGVEGGVSSHKSTCTGYSSIRRKRRPRPSYDDLDSTLSADIGDASFVVTSKKFDPVVIKKPQAFTRSSSERRPHIEEGKVLKRISENIFSSQDRETKFLDYGLIDLGRRGDEGDEKRCSYLNLERGRLEKEKGKKGKDRPVSWNEEQNAWLQRKRMAYNCTVRRMPTEDFDNKENFGKKEEAKKKIGKTKKFSIFR